MDTRSAGLLAVFCAFALVGSCGGDSSSSGTDASTGGDQTGEDSTGGQPTADGGAAKDAGVRKDAGSGAGNSDSDGDGDGVVASLDCDDSDSARYPDAPETCNDVDDDCDGEVDEDATDAKSFYRDDDVDGHGSGSPVKACSAPNGYVESGDDCLENDPDVYPGATELCNRFDDDCNGVEDDVADGINTYFVDADGDGYGADASTETSCLAKPPEGLAARGGDCDDSDPAVNPGASELCGDTVDQDCSGAPDDNASNGTTYYADADADGFGDGNRPVSACTQPAGAVASRTDCNDTAGAGAAINPSATDLPGDGTDSNCDGFDGNLTANVFVASGTACGCSDTDAARGTAQKPYCTLTTALSQRGGSTYLLTAGTHTLAQTVSLAKNASIYGGYTCGATWTRTGAPTGTIVTSAPGSVVTLQISGMVNADRVRLDGLEVRGPNMEASPSLDSVALRVLSSSPATVSLNNVVLRGNRAGNGANGAVGRTPSCTAPAGGAGGNAFVCGANGGSVGGTSEAGVAGGAGGGAGTSQCPQSCGGVGTDFVSPGGRGGDGPDGVPATSIAAVVASYRLDSRGSLSVPSANAGNSGRAGGGGGGGGAGGSKNMILCLNCSNIVGGAGGAGGAGGCGGFGGGAGGAGGSSIALVTYASTVSITGAASALVRGDAGAGGAGGAGSAGFTGVAGTGGSPRNRSCDSYSHDGGAGGNGGYGGGGGGGGGGVGGSSLCLLGAGSTIQGVSVEQVCSYVAATPGASGAGAAGVGGAGGTNGRATMNGPNGPNGVPGVAQALLQLPLQN